MDEMDASKTGWRVGEPAAGVACDEGRRMERSGKRYPGDPVVLAIFGEEVDGVLGASKGRDPCLVSYLGQAA